MNDIILTVQGYLLYPENYTKEQLKENYLAATSALAANSDYVAAYFARDVAYTALNADADYAIEYRLNNYFSKTGENRQDYIDAAHKDNKQ